jgi:hypothetical protein
VSGFIPWNRIAAATLLVLVLGYAVSAHSEAAAQEAEHAADEERLAQWKKMTPEEIDAVVLRNFAGLVRATHAYYDDHGVLPPAVVPNPDLPPEKRLSGFVLLLPYFAEATSFAKGKENERLFDDQTIQLAEELYRSLDLKKAWDDPANVKAAKTLLPALLVPGSAEVRDANGYAVSHVAFVRGARGQDNGAFTDDVTVTILGGENSIRDGTAKTLAFAQISAALGPWTAAGPMTARWMHHPRDPVEKITFGTIDKDAIYAANCDSSVYVLDLKESSPDTLAGLAGKSDGIHVNPEQVGLYRSMVDWRKKLRADRW